MGQKIGDPSFYLKFDGRHFVFDARSGVNVKIEFFNQMGILKGWKKSIDMAYHRKVGFPKK